MSKMDVAAPAIIHVPFKLRRRGGKTLLGSGAAFTPLVPPTADLVLVTALARAFRWKKKLDAGEFAGITELASAEKIDAGYVSRLLRLTLLPAEAIEAVLDGHQPAGTTLSDLQRQF